MSGERVERRLAAILASDVVGYSRLMGEDEEGTLAALKTLQRELIDPKAREHCGRLVKTTGHGALVEFASVVDAVRCAVEVQRHMAEPGGICVSRVVRDQVRDKLDFGFEDLGEQQVKNIARPVRVYRVLIGGAPMARRAARAVPDRPSIAVCRSRA